MLRAVRLLSFVGSGMHHVRQVLAKRGLSYVLLVVVVLIFVAAGLEASLEAHARNSTIHGYADGLWWAVTTISTVGYGDKVPVTVGGRAVATALILMGIALFVEQEQAADPRIDQLLAELALIRDHLGIGLPLGDPPAGTDQPAA